MGCSRRPRMQQTQTRVAQGARFFSFLQSWAELAGHALSWLPGDVMAAACALAIVQAACKCFCLQAACKCFSPELWGGRRTGAES